MFYIIIYSIDHKTITHDQINKLTRQKGTRQNSVSKLVESIFKFQGEERFSCLKAGLSGEFVIFVKKKSKKHKKRVGASSGD